MAGNECTYNSDLCRIAMDEMMIFIYGLHSEIMNVLQTEILEEKATACVLLRDWLLN